MLERELVDELLRGLPAKSRIGASKKKSFLTFVADVLRSNPSPLELVAFGAVEGVERLLIDSG